MTSPTGNSTGLPHFHTDKSQNRPLTQQPHDFQKHIDETYYFFDFD